LLKWKYKGMLWVIKKASSKLERKKKAW
jgi:hypothetical protein